MDQKYTHLEDFSEDIIAKAQSGLRITNRDLADQANIDLTTLKSLKAGEVDEDALRKVAQILGLGADQLVISAKKSWMPEDAFPENLFRFTSEFHSMTVNAYVLVSEGRAVLFDTGVDAAPILNFLLENNLHLDAVILTHGHPDHVAVLDPILQATDHPPVFAHPAESITGSKTITWGESFSVGPFQFQTLSTPGHTPGGTSFLVKGMNPTIVMVGDALFAGSVGGCAADYERALRVVRKNLLSLPDQSILCPGHGPLTTVADEKKNNPFFAI